MKLKRILSSVVAVAMIFSIISMNLAAFAAIPTTANNSTNCFIEADFDFISDVAFNRYYDAVVGITDVESAVGSEKFSLKLNGANSGVLIGDADTTAKFVDNGYDSNKVLVYKIKFYVSQAMFDSLPETTANYENKHLALEPVLISGNPAWSLAEGAVNCRAGFIKYNGKLYYADTGRITTNPVEVSVGDWHEMTWRIEPTDTQSQHVEIYIDDTKFTGLNGVTALIANGTTIVNSYEKAFLVRAISKNTTTETMYFDDIKVYQTSPADKSYANHMIYTDFNEEDGIINMGISKNYASAVVDTVTEKLGTENRAYKLTGNGSSVYSLGIANKNETTWNAAGYDASKPLIFKTKFYVSSALLNELSTSAYIRLAPMLYNTDDTFPNTDVINDRYSLAKLNEKLIYGDNGYFAGRYVELTEDEWHEIAFVLEPENQNGGAQKVYIDGEDKTSSLKLSAFTSTQFMQKAFSGDARADAFGISTPSTFTPTNSLYIDDVEVYQAKNAFTAQNSYSGQYSSTVTFSSPLNDSLDANVVVTMVNEDATAVDFDYTVTLNASRTIATVDFNDAAEGTSYKIKVADNASDNYYQTISGTKEFSITTPVFVPENADALNYMVYANYNKKIETGKVSNKTNVSQVSDDIADKLGEGNRAYKIESGDDGYLQLGITGSDNETWQNKGYNADKPLIFKSKFYISQALLNEMGSGNYIRFAPMLYDTIPVSGYEGFSTNETINANFAFTKNNDTLVYGYQSYLTGRNVEISTDSWHEIVFVLDPEDLTGGAQKVYIDGTDVSVNLNLSLYTNKQFMQTDFDASARASAFGVSTPSTYAPTNAFYVDDVQVYQANDALTAEVAECTDDYATVTFSTPVKKDETKIVISDSNGNILSDTLVTFAADAKSAKIAYNLSNDETYTITIRTGLTDEYYQYLTQDVTYEFSSVKSKVVYIEGWTDITPSSTGLNVDVTLKAGTQRADCVLIMAVYDEYGKLIGYDKEDITTSYDLSNPVTMSLNEDCSKADSVKLMLWNNLEDMIPLHKFDLGWTK